MFQIGDKVFVFRDYNDADPRTDTVSGVNGNSVVLANGSRFTLAGREWGKSKERLQGYIERFTASSLALVERRKYGKERAVQAFKLREAICEFVSMTPADDLDALYAHLRERGMPEVK